MPEQETGGRSENLPPGAVAPRTGTHVCGYCGPGGIAECGVVSIRYLVELVSAPAAA